MRREQLELYKRIGRWVRAAIYLRKSRAEEHMSLEETLGRHLAALTAYAEKYGFLVEEADIYKEVVSGESLFARPEMLRLMEAVSAGQYEAGPPAWICSVWAAAACTTRASFWIPSKAPKR